MRRVNCWKPEFDTGPGLMTEMARRAAVRTTQHSSLHSQSAGRGVVRVLNHSVWSPIDWGSRLWLTANSSEKDRAVEWLVSEAESQRGRSDLASPPVSHHPAWRGIAKQLGQQHAFALTFWAHTWRHG